MPEVVVAADVVDVQDLAEPGGQLYFVMADRGIGASSACERGLGQRAVIQFAVAGHGQPIEEHDLGGHSCGEQPVADESTQDRLVSLCRHAAPVLKHDIRDQFRAIRSVAAQHRGSGAYPRMFRKCGFHGVEFDAHATDLHLSVPPAQVLDVAVGQHSSYVSGTVDPLLGAGGMWARDKRLFGQLGAMDVAAGQADAGDAQLARFALRQLSQVAVEHMEFDVVDGLADRHRAGTVVGATTPEAHVHRGLGRAIQIVQPRVEPREEQLQQVVR